MKMLEMIKTVLSYLLHKFADLSAPLIGVRKRARRCQPRRELSKNRVALRISQLGNDPFGRWIDHCASNIYKKYNEDIKRYFKF